MIERRDYYQRIEKINQAIEVGRRSGAKRPILLLRYRTALQRLHSWQRKFTIAENKVWFYEDKVEYYKKRLGV